MTLFLLQAMSMFLSSFIYTWPKRELGHIFVAFWDIFHFFEVQKIENFRWYILAEQLEAALLHIVDEFSNVIDAWFNLGDFQMTPKQNEEDTKIIHLC